MSNAPIEVTTKYATTVDDLPAAWAFVMERLDLVGPDPHIEIRPIQTFAVGDMIDGLDGHDAGPWPRQFEVVIDGMVEEERA